MLNHQDWFTKVCDVVVTSSCDADLGGDINNKRVMTSFVFLLINEVVSWSSKKQLVAVSTIKWWKHNKVDCLDYHSCKFFGL